MARIENLLKNFERHVTIPWSKTNAGPERVWFAVYEPSEEMRLRMRYGDFENATTSAGHDWVEIDLTNIFPEWLAAEEYKESFFKDPETLVYLLEELIGHIAEKVKEFFSKAKDPENTVFALTGVSSLFVSGGSRILCPNSSLM